MIDFEAKEELSYSHKLLDKCICLFPHALSLCQKIKDCEESIERCNDIYKITEDNVGSFCKLLEQDADADSYLTSAAYYAFTGRDGLWIYHKQGAYIPFCWHPNVTGQILIFPQRGHKTNNLLLNLLDKLPEAPSGMRLARVRGHNHCDTLLWKDSPVILAPVVEQVLDWKYPVRILSTEKVMKMEGPDFRHIRNHVLQISRRNIDIEISSNVDKECLKNFIKSWADNHAENTVDTVELSAPYQKIMEMMENPHFKLQGLVFRIDDAIAAFTLWDISQGRALTANRYVNLCNLNYRGLPEFVARHTSEILFKSGIEYMNIGGSETVGLDQFKRKFMPAYSLPLQSVDVLHKEIEQLDRFGIAI